MFSRADLRRLIIPLLVEQTLAVAVGMVDTVMVAGVGEQAVSGVSIVDTINVLLINIFAALATGGAIVVGQYLGRREAGNSGDAAKQLVLATFVLSVAVMLSCLGFNGPVLSAVFGNIEPEVMAHARTYFYVTALSFPFIALYNAAAALFRSMGNSKISMYSALVMNLINILGNAALIYGLNLGVLGAALATLLSRIVSAAILMVLLRSPVLDISVRSYSLRGVDFSMVKRILRIGIPNGLENGMFQIGKILLTGLTAYLGTYAITANAVGFSIAFIEVIPSYALGTAIMTVVAQCVGAGAHGQAKAYTKYLMKVAYLATIALNIPILVFLKPILGLYQLSPKTFGTAYSILFLHGIATMVIFPPSFSLAYAYRATGDVKYPMVVSTISMWVFRVGLAYLMVYQLDMGLMGIWIAMIADWTFRAICYIRRWFARGWHSGAPRIQADLGTPSRE